MKLFNDGSSNSNLIFIDWSEQEHWGVEQLQRGQGDDSIIGKHPAGEFDGRCMR